MLNRIILPLLRLTFFVVFVAALARPVTGCTKSNDKKTDSTDTLLRVHDSAAFYVSILINIYNTSGVFTDTFSDDTSMKIYVVDGVVRIPLDSIRNFPPIAFPSSGTGGGCTATWIPDNIGVINITGATGILSADDTSVSVILTHSGTVNPKWRLSCPPAAASTAGGDAVLGWPPGFTFSLKQQSQDAFKLEQPGSYWDIWVYKDY